ncbi:MAG: type III pantothenate kinase, partial [candidate division Zixibacteria bacterium]|nr:type III pantothenate kinase [candidate division Zixibacteria bacterium]
EVGADRLADAVAAHNLYRGAVIVVDLGTATTFNAVSAKGEFLGGPIAPGIFSSSIALASTASQLFRVKLSRPDSALSKSTADALKAGIVLGAAGQIDLIVSRMERELKKKCRVVATGGGAFLVSKISRKIQEIVPDLTLKGLYFIHKRLTGKNRH